MEKILPQLNNEYEYDLIDSPDTILKTLRKDNSEYEKLKKQIEPMTRNQWPQLQKGIQQFHQSLDAVTNCPKRGQRIINTLLSLSEGQIRIKNSAKEMVNRVVEIIDWIHKQ